MSQCKYKKVRLGNGNQALVDTEDYDLISLYTWQNLDGYAACRWKCGVVGGITWSDWPSSNKKKFIKMERLILGGTDIIDHINKNRSDNRRKNLRFVTKKQNNQNVSVRKASRTGYKGVTLNKRRQLFMVSVAGKFYGYFKCPTKAAKEYNKIALQVFGQYAHLNKIKKSITRESILIALANKQEISDKLLREVSI